MGDLFNAATAAVEAPRRALPVIPQRGITEPIEWQPVTTLPDPTSRRMVLLWLASPLNNGTQCIVGFYDHVFATWRDIDGDTVPQQAITHWAEVEGPV